MRPMKFGLLAAMATAMLLPAAMVAAQNNKPAAVSEASRKDGMKDAPALVQTAALPCQVADARLIGKDAKAGASFYEVACSGGAMGFVIQKAKDNSTSAYTCLETAAPGPDGKASSLKCLLPGNADPKASLAPALTKAGVQCTPTNARAMGVNAEKKSLFEVACQEGAGYIILTSTPYDPAKDVAAPINCNELDDNPNGKCTLSDKATRLALVDRLTQQANVGCTVKDRRYIGATRDGATFYEASCQDGKGYIMKADAKGAMTQNWECSKAQEVLGGCTLTDAREAATAQAALYTRLAKTAGSNCDVDRYAVFPARGTDEVVELVCKDGNGAIGIFKASGPGDVMDCGHALAAGYKCSLSKDTAGYAALTADLKKYNYNSCVVSNARPAAKTQKGTVLVEVACADGLPGYTIEYNATPKVTSVGATSCRFAAGVCELPGNKS